VSKESKSLKLLRVIEGSYRPRREEVFELAELAKMNKLYFAYLRAVGDLLRDELLHVEARYAWIVENTVEVVEALRELDYALYKFRKPVDHVSVDLDMLVDRRDVSRAVRVLREHGFKVVVWEPYTVTLERDGFIVDLYTEPAFAWIVYMDGGRLLRKYAEDIVIGGFPARGLCGEAEAVVAAAHAVYKEHLVLLMDCLVAWEWVNRKAWSIAVEFGVEKALEELLRVCNLVRPGVVEAPYRLEPHTLLKIYLNKTLHDPVFRATMPNILKYMLRMRDSGKRILSRITRKSY